MKIYTKTGDRGKTSLIGGKRVSKYNLRIEAYGTLDELMSYIGLLRDQQISDDTKAILLEIEDRLMTCASILASDEENANIKLPAIKESDVTFLEHQIDLMEETLPPLSTFVLPGGHAVVSHCHVARCICRRAERIVTHGADEFYVPELVIKYINRLSDFLFVLARKFGKDLHIVEIPWLPRLDN